MLRPTGSGVWLMRLGSGSTPEDLIDYAAVSRLLYDLAVRTFCLDVTPYSIGPRTLCLIFFSVCRAILLFSSCLPLHTYYHYLRFGSSFRLPFAHSTSPGFRTVRPSF